MLKNTLLKSLTLIAGLILCQSCPSAIYDPHFEGGMWGWWELEEVVTVQGVGTPVSKLGYSQHIERKYLGGPAPRNPTGVTNEIDSVTIYRNRQVILQSRVANRISVDSKDLQVVYQLTNGLYYKVKIIGVDGPGNDKLWVSELVKSVDEIDKAATFRYVRTDKGKKPW